MKNRILKLLKLSMLILLIPAQAVFASPSTKVEKTVPNVEITEANTMMERLEEIKAMDKSDMTRKEKKMLREEVRTINKKMSSKRGIYISIAGLIIILLLLIILV